MISPSIAPGGPKRWFVLGSLAGLGLALLIWFIAQNLRDQVKAPHLTERLATLKCSLADLEARTGRVEEIQKLADEQQLFIMQNYPLAEKALISMARASAAMQRWSDLCEQMQDRQQAILALFLDNLNTQLMGAESGRRGQQRSTAWHSINQEQAQAAQIWDSAGWGSLKDYRKAQREGSRPTVADLKARLSRLNGKMADLTPDSDAYRLLAAQRRNILKAISRAEKYHNAPKAR